MKNDQSPYYYFGCRALRFRIPFMQGNDIKVLQELLNLLPDDIVNEPLYPDGVFGHSTRVAVKQFQAYFDLQVDGIAGPETFFALGHRCGRYATDGPVFSARLIKTGSAGNDVTILQNRLGAFRKGYLNRPAHGKYDNFSEEAVKRFQTDFPHLNPDGIVGPQTYDTIFLWAPLGGRTLRRARNGLDTYWLQWQLFIIGYYNRPLHGYFDSATEKAVRRFQADAGLRSDGVVGPLTYLALGTASPFPSSIYYYRVGKGDSVSKIAGLFSQNIEEIIKLNNLEPPDYIVYPGQMLLIPSPLTFHVVQKGETVEQVARKYAISLPDLKKANPLVPSSALLPDDLMVLPRFKPGLQGTIVYLHQDNSGYSLKSLNLDNLYVSPVATLGPVNPPNIFPAQAVRKVSVIMANHAKQIGTIDLDTGIMKKFEPGNFTDYVDWSPDGMKLALESGLVVDGQTGQDIFRFEGGISPQWFDDNKTLLYMKEPHFKTVDTETGRIETLLSHPDNNVWYFRMSADNTWLVFFAFIPPGRVTVSYLYNLSTRVMQEISMNDYAAAWGRSSDQFLLMKRDYYGEFFPWFYHNLVLYQPEDGGSNQIYAKGLEIGTHPFSPEDKWFALVLHNPSSFYNVKLRARDIFIKDTASSLITRVTLGEKVFSPNWL
jgi:peptidoglycan hydrolase-like protein with peptidoglycan-binding domain